jgi:hypothetical protein
MVNFVLSYALKHTSMIICHLFDFDSYLYGHSYLHISMYLKKLLNKIPKKKFIFPSVNIYPDSPKSIKNTLLS